MLIAEITRKRQTATLTVDADWDEPGAIVLRTDAPDLEFDLRFWLQHVATGLFGIGIGDDETATPADLCWAIRNSDWTHRIVRADAGDLHLPPPGTTP